MSELLDEGEPFDNLETKAPKRKRKAVGTEAEIELPQPEETFDPEPSDEELGELIDGTEDDISDLEDGDAEVGATEDCAPAVAAAVKAASVAASRKKSVSMAETKTKAEMIRDEIARQKAKSDGAVRPRDIIAALAAKGVTVAAPQVSVALRDFDKPKTAKAPKAKAEKVEKPKRVLAKVNAHAAPKAKKPTATALSLAELADVGNFVRGYASPADAISAIYAYMDYRAAVTG